MKVIPHWLQDNFRIKVGMFSLAILLWFLVVTEKTYDYTFNIPIASVGLKKDRTLARPIPTTARVRFHARGRELLRLIYVNKPYLRLDLETIPRNRIIKPKSDMVIIPGGLIISPIEIITPDSIPIQLDDYTQMTLPVEPILQLELTPGYVLVGQPIVEPSTAEVSGPEKAVADLKKVTTELIVREDLKHTIEVPARLVVPEEYGIETNPEIVKVRLRVERLGERSMEGVAITTRSVPSGRELITEPTEVKVQVSGAVSLLAKMQSDDLKAWVDYGDMAQMRPGWLKVHVQAPDGIEVRSVTPASSRVVVRKK
jgi:YbbR domain-containing protein